LGVNYQRLLVDHLSLVDQIARTTGRRRGLGAPELEDFSQSVRLRLVEHDYAILRKFQNRSSMWTYLSTVIERLAHDYCAEKWGRWRPSAKAERLGPAAITLERLVSRDGLTLEEALETMRRSDSSSPPKADLLKIWAQLPQRVRTTDVGEEAAAAVPSPRTAEEMVDAAELREKIGRIDRALRESLEQLSTQERVLLGLRFDQDLSMVQIAKVIGGSVPTQHRRLEKAIKQLRVSLSRSGLERHEIMELIGHPSIGLAPLLRAEIEKFLSHVRLLKRDG
jgi:RNA polymerase sigma factor for flagellar operon FliA